MPAPRQTRLGPVPDRPTQLALKRLTDELAIAAGALCPECRSRDTEDNGSTEYRCRKCDHRWGVDMGERYGY
jgi:tRNA(Ile2) C34 agmatinyltransferase TiaS